MKSMFVACLAAAVAAQPTQQWKTTSTSATLQPFTMGSLEALNQWKFDETEQQQQVLTPMSNEVSNVANEFANILTPAAGQNAYERSLGLLKFFDEDSLVQSYLNGEEIIMKGPTEFQEHLKLHFRSVDVQSRSIKLVGVNEEEALALMEDRLIGTVKKTGMPFDVTYFFVMELDALTLKIKTLLIVSKDKKELHDAFDTKAEKLLEDLVMAFFKSTPEELKDPNSLVWSKMSDNIKVKVNMYPEIYEKTTWNGKQELIDHVEEVHRSNFVFMDKLPELIQEMEYKVLLSTDSDVWVKLTWPGLGEGMIKHYSFDAQGLLAVEEITMLADLKPWQIYPMPFALDKAQAQQDFTKQKDAYGMANVLNVGGSVKELTQVGKIKVGSISKDEFEIEQKDTMKDTMWGSTWNKPKVDMMKETMKQKMKDAMQMQMQMDQEKEMQMQMDDEMSMKESMKESMKQKMKDMMQMDEQEMSMKDTMKQKMKDTMKEAMSETMWVTAEKDAMQQLSQFDEMSNQEKMARKQQKMARKQKRQQLVMQLAALVDDRD